MKRSIAAAAVALGMLSPLAASAYDPAPDQATIQALNERIDGDVNGGLVPNDRAALMRAEIAAVQKFVTNGDSQATAMLADIDRDIAVYDKNLDINEAGSDMFFHAGDAIAIAMRDGIGWRIDSVQNTDVIDVKTPGALNPPGVQGVYLAKRPGYTAITLVDPASGRHVGFRVYVVDKSASGG